MVITGMWKKPSAGKEKVMADLRQDFRPGKNPGICYKVVEGISECP